MKEFLYGILIGAAVMDFAWAYKMGIAQLFWSRIRRFSLSLYRKY